MLAQIDYVKSLPQEQRLALDLYIYRGDRFINGFLRAKRHVSPELMNYLMRHLIVFEPSMRRFGFGHSLFEYAEYLVSKLRRTIEQAPPTDKRMVIYRGSYGENYFRRTTIDGIYRTVGFMSTSFLLSKAMIFARKQKLSSDRERRFVNRIVVPVGCRCLYVAFNPFREYEVLLDDGAQFYVTKDFRETEFYFKDGEKLPFEVDEIVLLEGGRKAGADHLPTVKMRISDTGILLKNLMQNAYMVKSFKKNIYTGDDAAEVQFMGDPLQKAMVSSQTLQLVNNTPEAREFYGRFSRWCAKVYPEAKTVKDAVSEFLRESNDDIMTEIGVR
ncbi:MAG: ADP-ribosyltransferase [Sulfobacillus sp.]